MGNEKLRGNSTIEDMIYVMSEGNPGAIAILAQMMKSDRGIMNVLLCDSLNIRGTHLYTLYSDCCDKSINKFNRTLMLLSCGGFDEADIENNFNLLRSIPFIDDNIVIDGVPSYEEKFGPTHPLWKEYASKHNASFVKRLNAIINEEIKYNPNIKRRTKKS